MVKNLSINSFVFQGLKREECQKLKKMEDNDQIIDPEQVPGMLASGWTIDDFNELKK